MDRNRGSPEIAETGDGAGRKGIRVKLGDGTALALGGIAGSLLGSAESTEEKSMSEGKMGKKKKKKTCCEKYKKKGKRCADCPKA
jgi:hypothetical protein